MIVRLQMTGAKVEVNVLDQCKIINFLINNNFICRSHSVAICCAYFLSVKAVLSVKMTIQTECLKGIMLNNTGMS